MDVKSPVSRKPDISAFKIRELFPQLLAMHARWIDLTSVGAQAANDLVNTLVRMKQLETSEHWGVLEDNQEVRHAVKVKLELQMQAKADSLEATFEDICVLYAKSKAALEQIEAQYWTNLSTEGNTSTPVLRTAPLASWLEWGTRLMSMYTQDLILKNSIVHEISKLGSDERTKLLLYLNAWITSPLVDPLVVAEISALANTELQEVPTTTDSRPSSAQSTPSRSPSSKSTQTQKSSKSPSNKSSKVPKGSAPKR